MRFAFVSCAVVAFALHTPTLQEGDPRLPRCADVGDLVQWDWRVTQARPLHEELKRRAPRGMDLQLQHETLLYDGTTKDVADVHAMLTDLRDEAGCREIARARQARRSLLRDYDGQYGRLLLKVTWTGPQTKPVPGIAVHGTARLFAVQPFRAFRRRGVHYGNDDLAVFRSFALRDKGMERLVRAVLEHPLCKPAMSRGKARDWSVALIDTTGARRPNYVELLLDAEEGARLLAAIRKSVADDPTAAEVLSRF